ncbi:MAG: hypothetical protein K9G49_03695 [Taibaiella sp.]|nr:hypothetical protein [Taibaiella sp.]
MFVLNSEITIGTFRFSGVHDVLIKKSVHSIVETATIKIPAIAAIVSNRKVSAERITTATQFTEGDAVTIKLGYNGDMKTEFSGFVKHRKLDMPLEIECEGYSWLLRKNIAKIKNSNLTLKELLSTAVADLQGKNKITVQCEVDLNILNISLDNPTGFDVIKHISKCSDDNISCFFIKPDTLWCGTLYTDVTNDKTTIAIEKVRCKPGHNTIRKNTLLPHNTAGKPGNVLYSRKRGDGEIIAGNSTVATIEKTKHTLTLNHIKNAAELQLLANEKAYRNTYTGYEGSFVSFLQPYAAPGYVAYVKDNTHPEMDGSYLIESTEVHFSIKGARRIIELGIRTEK